MNCEFDYEVMSRVVCYVRSPIATAFVTLYAGKSLRELNRSDLDIVHEPSYIQMLALGGAKTVAMLKKGVTEFDRYFQTNEPSRAKSYTLQDMEDACLA